jgi:hypothetical protein
MPHPTQFLSSETGAIFDSTHTYRYLLWRSWSEAPPIAFVMLNPSTADAERNDPTIRRCIHFARSWGYGTLLVVNLFAYRATYPAQLSQVADPIGGENDRYLQLICPQVDRVMAAWGNQGALHQRHQQVLPLLPNQRSYCLGVNRSGHPRHPLYVHSDTLPTRLPVVTRCKAGVQPSSPATPLEKFHRMNCRRSHDLHSIPWEIAIESEAKSCE